MNWIILAAALELGWMPMGDFIMHEPNEAYMLGGSFYVGMETRAIILDHFFIGGSVETYVWHFADNGYYFDPERIMFEFNAGLSWGPLEIGFRHFCTHPIQTYLFKYQGLAHWEGAYEEVYLRLETKGWD